jgi:hypothetical protein
VAGRGTTTAAALATGLVSAGAVLATARGAVPVVAGAACPASGANDCVLETGCTRAAKASGRFTIAEAAAFVELAVTVRFEVWVPAASEDAAERGAGASAGAATDAGGSAVEVAEALLEPVASGALGPATRLLVTALPATSEATGSELDAAAVGSAATSCSGPLEGSSPCAGIADVKANWRGTTAREGAHSAVAAAGTELPHSSLLGALPPACRRSACAEWALANC